MTEGELGELLRATAAAVIAGEFGPETSPASFAQADMPTSEEIVGDPPAPAAGGLVEPAPPEPIVIRAADSSEPSDVERRVSRATEELPLLVAYQIEHDRPVSELPTGNIRATAEPETIAATPEREGDPEHAAAEVVQEVPALIVVEPVALVGAEPMGPENEPVSSESAQAELSGSPEAPGKLEDGEEERPEAGASVTLDGENNDEDAAAARRGRVAPDAAAEDRGWRRRAGSGGHDAAAAVAPCRCPWRRNGVRRCQQRAAGTGRW
jgi:hypothetical protein